MISRVEKIFLNLTTFLTAATGLVYAWMKYLLSPSDPFSVVNHPWQPGLLSGHVLVAPLLVFGFGLIAREHILGRYRDPRARGGRRTGILAALALVPMVSSGYLLQVVTSARGRNVTGILHLAAGILFLGVYGFHLALAGASAGRRQAPRRIRGAKRGKKGAGRTEAKTDSTAPERRAFLDGGLKLNRLDRASIIKGSPGGQRRAGGNEP